MAGLVRLTAAAVWLSAAALDARNGAAAKIAQPLDLAQDAGAFLFQAGEGIGKGNLHSLRIQMRGL